LNVSSRPVPISAEGNLKQRSEEPLQVCRWQFCTTRSYVPAVPETNIENPSSMATRSTPNLPEARYIAIYSRSMSFTAEYLTLLKDGQLAFTSRSSSRAARRGAARLRGAVHESVGARLALARVSVALPCYCEQIGHLGCRIGGRVKPTVKYHYSGRRFAHRVRRRRQSLVQHRYGRKGNFLAVTHPFSA
jgi:hypothetical protein